MGGHCSCYSNTLDSKLEDYDIIHHQDSILKSKKRIQNLNQTMSFKEIYDSWNEKVKETEKKLDLFVFNDNDAYGDELGMPVASEEGWVYVGQVNNNGEKNGRGIYIWPDGSKYVGYWSNDKANGYGRLIRADGDAYEGYWVNDKAQGKGKYIYFNGGYYEGYWENNLQSGRGEEYSPDGSVFTGSYKNGLKHGYGEFTWPDKSIFKGNFNNGCIDGKGTFMSSHGATCVGTWKNNKIIRNRILSPSSMKKAQEESSEHGIEQLEIFIWPERNQDKDTDTKKTRTRATTESEGSQIILID
jgi:hypothetical protein